ncbi:MAG TPA: DUF2127 domain-containing protein [Polyangia bacterium]|jgi:uncharacterized membrane protein (DUF2068 family)
MGVSAVATPTLRGERAAAREALALRSIVLYKTVKAAVAIGLALLLLALLPFGLPDWIAVLGARLRHHFVQAWSIHLADWLVKNVSRHRIELTIAALFLDGTLTAVEGWSLKRGFWWGPWLVVAASGGLLPFEIAEWLHHPRAGRAALFLLNVVIVLFLARHAWRSHRAKVGQRQG